MYYHFRDDPSRRVMVVVNFEPTMSDITDNKDNSFDKKGIMKKKNDPKEFSFAFKFRFF